MKPTTWPGPHWRTLSLLAALLLCGAALAAASDPPMLRAQVRLDRLDGPPLAGVDVSIGQQVVTRTDAEGRFQHRWPPTTKATATSTVTLQLSRPGEAMAVINDVLLTWPASLAASPAPVTLLVSAPETVTAWREFHLGHLALRTSDQSLDAAVTATRARLRRADSPDEYFMIISDPMGQLAGTWALLADKGPAAQMPALYRQALHAWWRGDPAQALQGLSLDVLQRAPSGAPATDAGLAQAWMLRAMLQSTLRDPRGALDTGWLATIALPERPEPWHLLGQLLMERPSVNHLTQAHGALTRALALYPTDNTAAIARLHDTLGRLLEDMKRPAEAGQHWVKAMALHTAMRSAADTVHTDAASRAGLNAARMQAMVGQHAQALATLNDVLVWRRALAAREPTLMRQYDVATTLLNQNLSLQKTRQACQGQAAWQEAIVILRELSELDPARFLDRTLQAGAGRVPLPPDACEGAQPRLVMARGVVGPSVGGAEAAASLPSASLVDALPPTEWAHHVSAWQASSRVHTDLRPPKPDLAAPWSQRVADLQRRMDAAQPGQHTLALARTLTRLGSLQQMASQPDLALRSYQQALAAWTQVRGRGDAPRWLPDIVETLNTRVASLKAAPAP